MITAAAQINQPLPVLPPERPRFFGTTQGHLSGTSFIPEPTFDRGRDMTDALLSNRRNSPVYRPPYTTLPVTDPTL